MRYLKRVIRKILSQFRIGRTYLHKRKVRTRRYISNSLGVENFFAALNSEGINYSVLRWFETLPRVELGEDVDILVSDEDIGRIGQFLSGTPDDGVPCDIYTVSGLPGSAYQGIPYYPPHLAVDVLSNSEVKDNEVRSPLPKYHLLTMVYHVLFHKGHRSGLPEKIEEKAKLDNPEHDYSSVLSTLFDAAGIPMPDISLSSLYQFLSKENWLPQYDTMEKLAGKNAWIHSILWANNYEDMFPGLAIFIVRKKGMPYIELIRNLIEAHGFILLDSDELSGARKSNAVKYIRGGVWGQGPWPKSGGDPTYFFVTRDPKPLTVNADTKTKHYGLTNQRVYDLKEVIRQEINTKIPRDQRCNVMHSSDNANQAVEYFQILRAPEDMEAAIQVIFKHDIEAVYEKENRYA